MKILHVTSGIDDLQGGTTAAIVAMAEAQHDIGLNVSVVSVFGKPFHGASAQKLRASGVPVTLIGPHGPFLAHHRDIGRLLPSMVAEAEVVHIHALWESIQHSAAAICRRMGTPHLFTAHGMLDPWSLAQGQLKKRLYLSLRLRKDLNGASAIHFTNPIECDRAKSLALNAPPLVEKYIIDLREFDWLPPPGAFREAHPSLKDRRTVLFLGRIHPKKGLDLLLPAFAAAEPRDAMLVLAGPIDEDYREELKRQIDQLKIESRVVFAGVLLGPQRIAAFADADLFVLPSYQENTGIAVIESLAAGTPVLISDCVNIHPDILRTDVGVVVPANLAPLTEAITRCLGDDRWRAAVGPRCREFVREEYDRLTLARRWGAHYQRLIDFSRAPRPRTNDRVGTE